MKQFYTLLVLAFTVITANAQIVNIPDANFKAKLLAASADNITAMDLSNNYIVIDSNNNGEIEVNEALQVYSLDVQFSSISELTGIEAFINLISLDISYNGISNMNVSQNVNLESLYCTYNQFTTINVSQNLALEYLNVSYNQLTTIDVTQNNLLLGLDFNSNLITSVDISQNLSLNSLYCFNNQITSLNVSQHLNLISLLCDDNQLTNLDVTQNSLLYSLSCSNNQLTSLDVTQNSLLYSLSCSNNQLTSLVVSQNPNLETFNCQNNQITVIDVTQNPLLFDLSCQNNLITNLNVTQNPALYLFNCNNNQLSTLDISQNSNLETVNCSNNLLTNLQINNASLQSLNCSNNLLTNLEISTTNSLQTLYCSNNQLINLDLLQNVPGLMLLDCSNNQITNLDVSSNTILFVLYCNNNQLTTLDTSSNMNLFDIYCSTNPLEFLIIKNNNPNSIINIDISNIPTLQYICSDEDDIESIQQLIDQNNYTNCHVNSYCSFVPGGSFYTIQLSNLYDSNNNGCDNTDDFISYLKYTIDNGTNNGTLISNETGNYSIPVQAGTYSITPIIEIPSYFTISPPTANVTFPSSTSPLLQDFCVIPNGVHYDVEVTVIPTNPARPGFDADYKIIYKNRGNQTSSGYINFIFDETRIDFVSSNPVNNSSATNSLTWNYINLVPFETRVIDLVFNINSPMETPAVNQGDILNFSSAIVDTTSESSLNNTFDLNQTVVNALDPNDKTCLEGNTITPTMVGNYVHYVIRFENTGTFAAENVVVTDVIDTTKFDISTLIPQSSSHSFVTRINSGKVEFIFENINLPFDDANNDGYVAFKIKTKPTLVLGNTFTNKANIYFDYNFPIVTNTTSTTVSLLSTQDFDFGTYFTLYPTPAKEVLNINMKATIGVKSVAIYNMLGQMVLAYTNSENSSSLDVSQLKTGTYIIKLVTDKGTASQQFVKK